MLDFDSLRRDRAHTLDCLRVFSLHSGQGKQGSCALPAGASKVSLALRRGHELAQLAGKVRRMIGAQYAGIPQHLRNGTLIHGDNRAGARHRLENAQTERFDAAGVHEAESRTVCSAQRLRVNQAEEAGIHGQIASLRLELITERAVAADHQHRGACAEMVESVKQEGVPLVRRQRPDREHKVPAI